VASGEHAIAGTAVNGVLYQSIVNQNRLSAFDEQSGRVLWSVRTAGPVKMSPLVDNASVIFGDTTGILYNVDRRTGHIRHTASFKDPFSTSPPVIIGETLLVANGRYIFAIPTSVL
jgi:outer membrane protein assembly factor BamB